MCAISGVFTNENKLLAEYENNLDLIQKTIAGRGPDYAGSVYGANYILSHRLLSINGFVKQPFESDDYVLAYNGEIYNWNHVSRDYSSDGLLLFEMLSSEVYDSVCNLDGEYAICLLDKKKNEVYLISDIFSTKPLYYSIKENSYLAVGTYASTVNAITKTKDAIQVPPNSIVCINLSNYTVKNVRSYHVWDFTPKYDSFERWNNAFSSAIKKRVFSANNKYFIGLSNGYDSGLIASELINSGHKFTAYTIRGAEDNKILKKRHRILKKAGIDVSTVKLNDPLVNDVSGKIQNEIDDFNYFNVDGTFNGKMKDDKATVGLAAICKIAHKQGHRIYISGQGADEITSDYGINGEAIYSNKQSTIAGNFEGVRSKWTNFDSGFQANYLGKEERISAHWSIEGRYPFLDKRVVQEFLHIDDHIRSIRYKSVLSKRLEDYNFPVAEKKLGFNPSRDIRHARRRAKLKKIFWF